MGLKLRLTFRLKLNLILFILLSWTSFSFANINKKIKSTNSKISKVNKNYKVTYSKVQSLKNKLKRAKNNLYKTNKKIKKFQASKYISNKTLLNLGKQLNSHIYKYKSLNDKINKQEEHIVSNLLKDMSFVVILGKKYSDDADDLVQKQIFVQYLKILNKDSKAKANKLNFMMNKSQKIKKNILKSKNSIVSLKKSIANLKYLKSNQAKIIASINSDKIHLDTSIKKIKKRENQLYRVLRKLKVVKKRKKKPKKNISNSKKIRQVNSSYSLASVYKYRGRKTIAPIKTYKLIKKFGSSFDETYNIKVFNEFIVLKSLRKNQKVRNVLGGRVVFANTTPTLDKTVIIKHKNGIHTIYANLSKIAPGIRKGKKLKKGFAIGKVSDELIFEVTKNSRFINPERFVNISRRL